jgi:hypothetical protein
VTDDRWARIAKQIDRAGDSASVGRRVCSVAAKLLSAGAVSLVLVVPSGTSWIDGSDSRAIEFDEQQFTLGDGPTLLASQSVAPVMVDDMASAEAREQWPVFAPAAVSNDALAVFSFPLRIGAARLGVMSAYRDHPGALSAVEYADGLVLASLATMTLLQLQAGEKPGELAEAFSLGVAHQSQLQLAAGMVSEQLNVSITEALVRLRASAYSQGLPVTSIARFVVSRELTFDNEEYE